MSNPENCNNDLEKLNEKLQKTKNDEKEEMQKKEERKQDNDSEKKMNGKDDKIPENLTQAKLNEELPKEISMTSLTGICDGKGVIQITGSSADVVSKPSLKGQQQQQLRAPTTCSKGDKSEKTLQDSPTSDQKSRNGKENGELKMKENKKETEKNKEQNSGIKTETEANKKSVRKQGEETENKDGKKLSNWVAGLPPGAVRNLGNTGLKGQSLPLFLSMPAGGGGGLSLLSAGLPPGRYVILPSTTSSIPSISNISSNVSSLTLGGKSSLLAQISNKSISVVQSSSSATTTTTAVRSSTPSLLQPNNATTEQPPAPSGRSAPVVGRSFRGRRKSYTTAEKLAMIEAVESGQKKSNVADQFGVAPSTLACILLQKNKIRCDQIKIDMSRRRIRRTRTMPIVPGPLGKHSSSGGRGDTERRNDNPFVHFLSPLSPSRPTMFEESPEEIFSMPDLSDRMGMEGRPTSPGKLEGSSNYLTCSPLISAMSGMHEDLMSGAGPSSSSQDTGESEGVQGDYDQDIDVKAEPEFSVEPEICEDESQNTNQSSCDRRSSQSSPTPPAGMTGPYLLKKETHCATILDQLLRDDTFCDVTLTAEGQSLRAHKLVLCLASNYFRQVLNKESNIQNVIVFRDIRFTELKNLITFIYTGEATVDAAELESFMKTAEMLEVTSLCDGQRKLPKNLIPRPKEAETEKNKTTFAAKRALNSCVSPTPSKTRRIEETPVSRHQTKSVASHPSTSGSGGLFAPQVILSTSIKTEPSADEDRIDEEYHSFEQCQPSPPPLYHQDSETPSSGETGNDPGPFSDKVLVGKCPFCPTSEQVLQGIALTKHLSTYHPDKTVFCCENCSRAFLKKGAYEAHKHDCNR